MPDLPGVEAQLIDGQVIHARCFSSAYFKNWNYQRMNGVGRNKRFNDCDFRVFFCIDNESRVGNNSICIYVMHDVNRFFQSDTFRNSQ